MVAQLSKLIAQSRLKSVQQTAYGLSCRPVPPQAIGDASGAFSCDAIRTCIRQSYCVQFDFDVSRNRNQTLSSFKGVAV